MIKDTKHRNSRLGGTQQRRGRREEEERTSSEVKLLSDLGGNILEADGSSRDSLETDSVQTESRQLADLEEIVLHRTKLNAYFHFPLDQGISIRITVDAEDEVSLTLLVVAIVRVENFTDFPKHLSMRKKKYSEPTSSCHQGPAYW